MNIDQIAPQNDFLEKEKESPKAIGILGGMGPVVSGEFYWRVVDYSQRRHGADQLDSPICILHTIALPEFDETGTIESSAAKEMLIDGIIQLERVNAECIAIPCNSVHRIIKEMREAVAIPVISIVEEVCKSVQSRGVNKVAVLSGIGTHESGLYREPLKRMKVGVVDLNPGQLDIIRDVILNVMGKNNSERDRQLLRRIIEDLHSRGAEAVIIGCTELSLAIGPSDVDVELIDSLEVLVHAAVDFAYS